MAASDRFDEVDERGVPRPGRRQTNELVLPEGEYAYIQDTTKGVTQVRTGPAVVNLQGQDRPVLYDEKTRRFQEVPLVQAAQIYTVVPKGYYAVLQNPAVGGKHPTAANTQPAMDLNIGQREHISGPATFALWPRQTAVVIAGHQLRLNQYLLARVYDEDAARANWKSAVMKAANSGETTPAPGDPSGSLTAVPDDLTVGQMLVIRGTEVSFYIPPTGIEVVQDENGSYVREALTLERLQYCILIDENGNKQYVRGPNVVFPLPTQRFHANKEKDRKFRPVELNGKIQGIHIKVISAYVDENGDHGTKGHSYQEGDELFITGETTPIYFPCEQHSAVTYDKQTRHYATAIPAGDGRYVLDRQTGEIRMVTGGTSGTMLLPDPRQEVFVRRVLTAAECDLMYPGNPQVLEYNTALQELQVKAPTTRKGVVSDGDARGLASRRVAAQGFQIAESHFADVSPSYSSTQAEMGGDEFTRAASYTEPRQVTLGNDKFAGVPKIDVWTGYAVLVKDTAGNRRVEIGPKRVLLGFNESLEALVLSTGKPKTTDRLLKTAYLQVAHNKVSDIFEADTSDLVRVQVKTAMRVNFEGDDPVKWFSVANYVKLLSDHVRSVLKANIRKISVEEFFTRSEDFIRDTILGSRPKDGTRKGMSFTENGMYVYDVEVLAVDVEDTSIQDLLTNAQHSAVETGIRLANAKRQLEARQREEEFKRQTADAQASTSEHMAELTRKEIERKLQIDLATAGSEEARLAKALVNQQAKDAVQDAASKATRERQRLDLEQTLAVDVAKQGLREQWLTAETAATVNRLQSVQAGFSEALLALGNQDTLVKVAEAMSVQQFLGGKNLPEVVGKVFDGTPLASLVGMVQKRAAASAKS